MIELSKSEVEVITSYLDLLEELLSIGGAKCRETLDEYRAMLKEVRSNNQELKDKMKEV